MKQINHSWKGFIHINGIDYHWEQFATSNPKIFMVKLIKPITISFEFRPQQQSLALVINHHLQLLK